jgi:hypothetical protein
VLRLCGQERSFTEREYAQQPSTLPKEEDKQVSHRLPPGAYHGIANAILTSRSSTRLMPCYNGLYLPRLDFTTIELLLGRPCLESYVYVGTGTHAIEHVGGRSAEGHGIR